MPIQTHEAKVRAAFSLVLGFGLVLLTGISRANLLTNGSFELGPPIAGQWVTLGSGSTAITGWTVSRENIDYVGSLWSASDGSRSLDLSGDLGGAISQTFATTPGLSYAALFDVAGNPENDSKLKRLRVTAGAESKDFTFDTTGLTTTSMGWTKYIFAFTATASQTTLTFESLNSGWYGPALDNVRVLEAAVFDVNKTEDTADGICTPSDCSLREAVIAANAAASPAIINVPAGTYVLTRHLSPEDSLAGYTDEGTNAMWSDLDLLNDMVIKGAGAALTIIDGNRNSGTEAHRVFQIGGRACFPAGPFCSPVPEVSVSIESMTIANAFADGAGSGILNFGILNLAKCFIKDNGQGLDPGAGIANQGRMTISECSVTGNKSGVSFSSGGGIYNNKRLVVERTTISENAAGQGGGILNTSTLAVVNSTISDNFAFRPAIGGGISNQGGTLTVVNSTVSENQAGGGDFPGSQGGLANSSGDVKVQNTIIAGNFAGGLGDDRNPNDCGGAITSLGNNIIGTTAGCSIVLQATDQTGDPGLGGYTDDGTPGNGHFPLLATSPAIDAGSLEACLNNPLLATDQLGQPRSGICDMGAVEFGRSLVNDLVTFAPLGSTFSTTSNTTGCPAGFVGKFSFSARLADKNTSPELTNLLVKVATLSNGNLLQNADGGPGGVGATLTVPATGAYADGILSPGQFVDVPFVICLKQNRSFGFFVDVYGAESDD